MRRSVHPAIAMRTRLPVLLLYYLLPVLFLGRLFMSLPAFAQSTMAGGWAIEVYGMVQVEPDPKVLTFGVKDENIRFAIHNVHSANPRFPIHRFLSDNRKRTPGVYIKGPEEMLDTLIQEKPSQRVLKLTGVYYPESRTFVLNGLRPVADQAR